MTIPEYQSIKVKTIMKKWKEQACDGYRLITQQGGATLGYSPESGLRIIEQDGYAFKDLDGGAGHFHAAVGLVPVHQQGASVHLHGCRALAPSRSDGGRSRGASSRSACLGYAGAAFPYAHPDVAPVNDLRELYIDPVRKQGMAL